MPPALPDMAAWPRLSPWLDELLDLPAAARPARLAQLRMDDAALADDLAALLQRLAPLDAAGFLSAPALQPPAGLQGLLVGAYRLQRELGQGGMGSVWLAERADGRFQGLAAIKFMHGGLAGPGMAERFLREGQLLARLDHPHIARLLDAGVVPPGEHPAAGRPYLVLEHVDGQPIDAFCAARLPGPRQRVQLLLPVLDAVAHAHSRLVLHRDLKPSNILVTDDGRAKLLDFGIARLLAAPASPLGGEADGTPAASALTLQAGTLFTARYAAPEQLQGQEVTTATDVYALGVLLYELLGGGHPTARPGETQLAQMQAVLEQVPLRLSEAVRRQGGSAAARQARALRGDLETVLARALKKAPAERYPNAAALAEDLRRWLDHEAVAARPDSAGTRLRRFLRRHRTLLGTAGAAATLALAGGAALALWQAQQARAERAEAEALVQFMLGDLRNTLVSLGRVDLLKSVADRALAYYDRSDAASLDAASLDRRAQALRLLAETARLRLDTVQARQGIEQAARITALLVAKEPRNHERLLAHGDSLQALSEAMLLGGDSTAAIGLATEANALAQSALTLAPETPRVREAAWMAGLVLSKSLMSVGLPLPAMEAARQVEEATRQRAADDDLQARRMQSQAMLLGGMALSMAGRYRESAPQLQRSAALMDALPDAASHIWERRQRADVRRSQARALLMQGELAQARVVASGVIASMRPDADADPRNAMLAQESVLDHLLLGEVLWLLGDAAGARQQAASAEDLVARVGEVPKSNRTWHLQALGGLLQLRTLLQPPTAAELPRLQAWMADYAEAAASGARLHSRAIRAALELGLVLGDSARQQGRADEAAAHWQAVLRHGERAAQDGDPVPMVALARALQRLGQPEQARQWLASAQATDYRHPDLLALQQALAGQPVAAVLRP